MDEASISTNARDHLAWVEALTRELERQEAGREERVREVGEKLRNGELDDPEVYRAAAEAMLGW